eukprot:CAMPEP_0198330904 /NCGR_PEP_ID=MMETSP1450-20131203/17230_1 /TAXON_ID=753684 ORGANISM="Madagascaria erythrocladiodes, Strain CCMP3234" /NCGR_SAMPLE_ID=MMETSP1450 /ASSEMBLY_ACC=CAM_ASM_001115 /LENGTH=170 /DNA_ID=CAMNT_0044035237 /DNA_START=91 /DNA_END=603 /DNA_ORIENTATION=-
MAMTGMRLARLAGGLSLRAGAGVAAPVRRWAMAPGLVGGGRRFMSDFPADRKYKSSHEWIKVDGGVGVVGITTHAASELGDIVFVDLPEVGSSVEKDGTLAAIESVKAASDIYSPVTGKVVEVNEALSEDASLVNQDAHEKGWIAKVELDDAGETDSLMDSSAYAASLDS